MRVAEGHGRDNHSSWCLEWGPKVGKYDAPSRQNEMWWQVGKLHDLAGL